MNDKLYSATTNLDNALEVFEDADSDKRYNAARRNVIVQWELVLYALEFGEDDEDEAYCESCGDVLCESDEDIYGALGDYCAGCADDEKVYCEVCSREIEHGETHCWQCAS